MRNILFTLIILFTLLGAQTKRDPRAVAMAGAYTTIPEGIFSVGYNPGMIGLQQNRPFMLQGLQFDFGLVGNFFSIQNIAMYSGDTLDITEKNNLFNQLRSSDGMAFFMDTHMPIPLINISKGNKAFSANNIILQNYRLPIGLLELMFYGNGQKENLDIEFNYEILGLNEFGFSFGIPFKSMSWGITAKYIQGLFYLGVDEDSSSSNLITDDLGIYGSGKYILKQGVGGSGFGFDVGVVTRDYNGWQFGASIINLFGTIRWKQGSDDKAASMNPLTSSFYPFTWGDSTLNAGESILYTFEIDTIRADNLSQDSLFTSETKFFTPKNPQSFITRVPATFRLGLSKKVNNFLIASDLVAGFEDKFYARKQWKWSIGAEWTRVPTMPMRIGFGWGGGDLKELGMGFGVRKGAIMFDFGFAFRNGLWLHTMKGFNLSFGITVIGKERTSEKKNKSGPLPKP